MSELEQTLRNNWNELNSEIELFCEERGLNKPLIIAVSKTKPIEVIEAAYDIGIRHFGENYAQELEEKAKIMSNVNWHFIGHLQRSNVGKVIPYIKYLHTLDSEKLVNKIAKRGYDGETLIQIKISDELSKHGIEYNHVKVEELVKIAKESGLKVTGLMGIGGLSWSNSRLETEFVKLSQLKDELGLVELSIGMSGDYKTAIQCGSTMVRIGTRIFGQR